MRRAEKVEHPVVASFAIRINGSPLSRATAAHVVGVTVDDDLGLPGMFAFQIAGSDDQKASWVDSDLFAIGGVVDVRLGYADRPDSVIIGEITALEPEFALDHLPNLTVRGYDRLHRLQRGRKTRTFAKQKDSDAASTIATEAGLTSKVTDSRVVHEYLMQANQTDFDFLAERASCIGYELRVEDKTLLFQPARNDRSARITLTFQSDLLEFYPRLTAAGQVNDVSLRRWSVKDKNAVVGQARSGDETSTMGGKKTGPALVQAAFGSAAAPMTSRLTSSQAEADQLARARFNDIALDFITGDGVCWGRSDLRAGTVIEIADIGRRFSGPYYVTGVRHRYHSQHGYVTEFSVRRNAS